LFLEQLFFFFFFFFFFFSDITRTVVQFSQLDEIEIGGTKGKSLTIAAQAIWSDFQTSIARFELIEYDMMDVSSDGFANDYYEFRQEIKELERRLSSLLVQAFDDAACMQARFNLLDSFRNLLQRPNIESEIEKRMMTLISNYGIDLTIVQELFLNHRDEPDVANNLPPVSGAISWCRGLIERIYIPHTKLQGMSKMLESDESKEILKRYHSLRSSLEEYVIQKVGEWGRDVENASQSKLRLPLLKRERESKYLHVNFSSNLTKLLREVRYFLLMDLIVPESAVVIFGKTEYFRSLNHGLDRVVTT
jgi:dynein heavy chain